MFRLSNYFTRTTINFKSFKGYIFFKNVIKNLVMKLFELVCMAKDYNIFIVLT